jgi:serine acetyltransferase
MKSYTYLCNRETIQIPLPETYGDCVKLAKADYKQYAGATPSTWQMAISLGMAGFYLWFRLSSLHSGRFHRLCTLVAKFYQRKFRIFISANANIGPGLVVARGVHILSAPTVNIGSNVRLCRYTIIGKHKNAVVSIGNNVSVGSYGAIIDDAEIACGRSLAPCSFIAHAHIRTSLF